MTIYSKPAIDISRAVGWMQRRSKDATARRKKVAAIAANLLLLNVSVVEGRVGNRETVDYHTPLTKILLVKVQDP